MDRNNGRGHAARLLLFWLRAVELSDSQAAITVLEKAVCVVRIVACAIRAARGPRGRFTAVWRSPTPRGAGTALKLKMNSPFQILGLTPSATPEEITAAHREMIRAYHPDRQAASCSKRKAETMAAAINAARDAVLTKAGKLTPLARELRRQHMRGSGATIQHTRHTFYRGGNYVGEVDEIHAHATNAAMQELIEQILNGEAVDVGEIARAAVRAVKKKGRHR